MRKRLGCLSRGGVIAGLLTALVIVAVMLVRGGRLFSPGPLNAQAGDLSLGGVHSHAEIGGRCAACHAAPWSSELMSDRCLACHADVNLQLQDPSSLHGALGVQPGRRACFHCHPEHHGATAQLSVVDARTFPHDATGYSLQGHATRANDDPFACVDCHGAGLASFDVATCAGCHRGLDAAYIQDHVAAFGTGCLACHDGIDTYGPGFDHNAVRFALVGKHASLSCADCHGGAHLIADLQATPQDCFACHQQDDAHDGQFGQDCAACHTAVDWQQATFDHNQTAFPLVGKHVDVACNRCHVDNVFQGTPQDCFACHQQDDAHDGQFGQDCAACHTAVDWQQATFDHNQTAFPLVGKHVDVACNRCHVDNVFQGTPQDCAACHQQDDAHDGQFGQDCAACHTAVDWQQATFDHSQTAFPLTGAHLQVECTQCHADNVFKGTPTRCASCHDEPAYHAGLFSADCASCHGTDAWSPARFDGPHTFPIDHGERGPSPCQTCHPDELSAYTCYGCHEHQPASIAAEHREEGITDLQDCVRCHPTGREEEGGGD
jgi:hypothetical protein